jgi:hypothetical protein
VTSLRASTRRAALAAFLLFATALFVVGPAEASRTTDARSSLAAISATPLAPSSLEPSSPAAPEPVEPIDPVESSPRFGFAEDLGLLDVEARSCGFELFGGVGTKRCVLTYARNNPLKYVDPDGRQAAPPRSVSTAGSIVFGSLPLSGEVHDAAGFLLGYDIITWDKLNRNERMLSGAALLAPIVGGALLRKIFTADQDALIQLAKEAKKTGGVTDGEARTLRQWADEYGVDARGPETHKNRPQGQNPHIHVGPVDHIPVKPAPAPPPAPKPPPKPPCPGSDPCKLERIP